MDARLKAARASASGAMKEFALASGEADKDDKRRPEPRAPEPEGEEEDAVVNLGSRLSRGSGSQKPGPPGPAGDNLSFEEIMNLTIDIEKEESKGKEEEEFGFGSLDEGEGEPEKPVEDWEVFRAVTDRDVEEIEALKDFKANFNCVNEDGQTPLHKAADMNAPDVITALCQAGANVDAQTTDGTLWTALHIGALNGYDKVVAALLKFKPNKSIKDSRGETALQWAQANNEEACVKLLS